MKAKKWMAGCLMAALLASQGTAVFAAEGSGEVTEPPKDTNIVVNGTYAETGTPDTVYKVDLAWGSMEFTYTANANERVWNPDTHEYTEPGYTGEWSCTEGADTVSVTNHSNAAVEADFSYAAADSFEEITGTFTNASVSLPTAEGKALDAVELTGTTKLKLAGALPRTAAALTNIGQITVTINGTSGN